MRCPASFVGSFVSIVGCLGVLALAGCGEKSAGSSTAADKRGSVERRVALKVVRKGDGSTAAVVPVFIGRRGPFRSSSIRGRPRR